MDLDQLSQEELCQLHRAALDDRTSAVRGSLGGGSTKEALGLALKRPPEGVLDEALVNESAELVHEVMQAVKDAEIAAHISELEDRQRDVLMKYVYRGMAACEDSKFYLKWHAAIVKQGGEATIVRSMAERRSIL